LGIVGSNLTLQGPLVKNKASFIVSARYSNLGVLSSLFSGNSVLESNGEQTSYSFYDINAKLNYKITDKTQAFFSVFNGYDLVNVHLFDTNYDNTNDARWGNTTATFRVSHIISPKVFAKLALIYSKFEYVQATDNYGIEKGIKFNILNYQSTSNVEDLMTKVHVEIFPTANITMLVGIDFVKHNFLPNSYKTKLPISEDSLKKFNIKTVATEIGIYLENNINLSSRLLLNLGARYANYQVENQTYHSFEPRLGLNYDLGKDWIFKFGQSSMRQFVHLLSNNGVGLPHEIWLPATTKVPPQSSMQTALGIYKKIPTLGLTLSLEAYHKTMLNLVDYPEGSNFLGTTNKLWDEQVEKNGRGRAYGIEFYLAKNIGKLTGWIAYTHSKTERNFEHINNGSWYPLRYDRRHNLSIVGMYKLSKKWSVNATWIYQTGNAVTLPNAAMLDFNYNPTLIYSGRNNQRMPDSHRLDIGFSRKVVNKRGWVKTLNIGLYNAYNQSNPYALDVVTKLIPPDFSNRRLVVKQYTLFTILPSISYSVKF
jgi:outer membrane receptor for ferrienterochelin and colicin